MKDENRPLSLHYFKGPSRTRGQRNSVPEVRGSFVPPQVLHTDPNGSVFERSTFEAHANEGSILSTETRIMSYYAFFYSK